MTPPNTDADSGPQATIRVSCEWLPFIRGALQQLLLETTWKGDADTVGLAQRRAFNLIDRFAGNGPGDCGTATGSETEDCLCGDEEDDCVSCLRFNGGKLQQFSCGVWEDVPGQESGGGTQSQPGAGSVVPAPGQTVDYCFKMGASNNALLPATVSTGDTILIEKPGGAWSDTIGTRWFCPSGNLFVLGSCIKGTQHVVSTDYLNTAPHMGLIAQIGGVNYDVYNSDGNGDPQVFTVPGGISNQPVLFAANLTVAAAAIGTIEFCAKVTNNQADNWTATLDLTLSPYGFVPEVVGADAPGVWTAGVGWTWQDFNGFAVCYGRGLDVKWSGIAAFHLDSIHMIIDYALGIDTCGEVTEYLATNAGGSDNIHYQEIGAVNVVSGTDISLGDAVANAGQTAIRVQLFSDDTATLHGGTGSCTLKKIVITGHGSNPF